MLQCARTNRRYMDLRAGHVGYPKMVHLYRRIAVASVALATEYSLGKAPGPHEPAVDAFWWAVDQWSSHFTSDLLKISPLACSLGQEESDAVHKELSERFCRPHRMFALWLRSGTVHIRLSPVNMVGVTPGRLILLHDYHWTREVVRLTTRWGLFHHLKDLPALLEACQLIQGLRRWPPSDAALAYLESDLAFLQELFGHFGFSAQVSRILEGFLHVANTDLAAAREE